MSKVCATRGCSRPFHANGLCNACDKKRRRRLNPDVDKLYEKTPKGFLMRLYRNMQSRVQGVQKLKYHLYKGKSLLDRQSFYDWAENHPQFLSLFNSYISSGYDRKKAPSVDRINPELGYELSNMEWVTHSENSRRSSISRKRFNK